MKIYLNKKTKLKTAEIIEFIEAQILHNHHFAQIEYEILDSGFECNFVHQDPEGMEAIYVFDKINSIAEKDDDIREETLEFCTDCTSLHANGEVDEMLSNDEMKCIIENCECGFKELESAGYRDIGIKDPSEEKFFSSAVCECCGALPGDRFLHTSIREEEL